MKESAERVAPEASYRMDSGHPLTFAVVAMVLWRQTELTVFTDICLKGSVYRLCLRGGGSFHCKQYEPSSLSVGREMIQPHG